MPNHGHASHRDFRRTRYRGDFSCKLWVDLELFGGNERTLSSADSLEERRLNALIKSVGPLKDSELVYICALSTVHDEVVGVGVVGGA